MKFTITSYKITDDIDVRYKSDLIAWIKWSGQIAITDHLHRHPLVPLYKRHRPITSATRAYTDRKIVIMLFISSVFI